MFLENDNLGLTSFNQVINLFSPSMSYDAKM